MSDDELTFEQIHETFRPRIRRYLARLVGEPDAEDLTQEVMVKVSQSLASFRGESRISTWIYRIATNTAIDRMRSPVFRAGARTGSLSASDESDERDVTLDEQRPSLDQQVMRKEMYDCFCRFVQNLPPKLRTVVALNELEDLSNSEIAEILGLSLDAVKIRLHRGRALLIRELKAHCRAEDWL